jgi:hypothetical protein
MAGHFGEGIKVGGWNNTALGPSKALGCGEAMAARFQVVVSSREELLSLIEGSEFFVRVTTYYGMSTEYLQC